MKEAADFLAGVDTRSVARSRGMLRVLSQHKPIIASGSSGRRQ
jgi:hypothetical protein